MSDTSEPRHDGRELHYIGRSGARPEGPDKVAGKALYIHDLTRPGMLYGKIKFSAHAHARIKHIDTQKAERLPGVKAVITGFNTPPVRVGFLRDNVALKRDKVRQFRDEVAAVAAIDPDIAQAAVDLIEVEYEPLPAVFDPIEALAAGAPQVHEVDGKGRPLDGNLVPLQYHHDTGDVDAARQAAEHVVTGDYSVPLIQQSCMGTAGCIAEFDMNGNLTICAKTQIPFLAQRDFNRALEEMGLCGKNARVVVPALGGGFGTGLDTHCYEYIAILLAWRSGRPVKILYNREEEFAYLSPRQSARVRVTQGCDRDGVLTFRDVDVVQDNGAYASWGATFPTVMLLPVTSLYRVPNVRFDAKVVYTNNTYCQAMRGYGNPEATWGIECNLDELAEQAGIEPFEIRRINCNRPNEVTPMGLKVSTCGLDQCLDVTGKKLGFGGRERPRGRGVGMASLIHVGGSGRIYRSDASGLILKLDDYGNVNVYHGGVEMGQGLHAVLIAAVADSLGVLPEHVHINPTDTGTCPWDVGTHASRGAFMACNSAILAAKKIRPRIFELCKEMFPKEIERSLQKHCRKHPDYQPPGFDFAAAAAAGAENFELRDSVITLRGAPDEPWAKLTLGRFLRALHFQQDGDMLTERVFYDPPSELPDWRKGYGNMSATYTYGTQGVEVEVDEETGEIKILKMVAALDIGKVLNPQALAGQTYGGIAQGIGYALYEEVKTEDGRIQNPGFTDYKIPTASEMDFPIELEFIETDDSFGPFGAKGAGEPGLVPTAPAIANAVYQAVGVRIRDLPITPEKVLAALRSRSQRISSPS
ncbi:MAG: xanthine dehydrogenase family protein molybdopterin-binding subunit [Planctomycetota bacterium]|jgi:xanthine dehydrogenase molybdenum-binding subunit